MTMNRCIFRFDRHGAAEPADALIKLPKLCCEQPRKMQRIGMTRVALQHRKASRLSSCKIALLEQSNRRQKLRRGILRP